MTCQKQISNQLLYVNLTTYRGEFTYKPRLIWRFETKFYLITRALDEKYILKLGTLLVYVCIHNYFNIKID